MNSRNVSEGEERDTSSGIQPPAISLPKGGGAIKGIEEKYSVNPVTGSASFSIPVYATPSRSDFYPKLSLSYDSGSGNGPFGLGWSLSIPSITRKTEKGLPRYLDNEGSDIFILSGSEDLVPVHEPVPPRTIDGRTYRINRYRPRIEGLFARIEKWVDEYTGETFWRSISKDNISTWYGKTNQARIADKEGPGARVFQWLIEESRDDRGNIISYIYEKENFNRVARSASEENRFTFNNGLTNRYIKRIKYGNRTPGQSNFLFEVLFDYGEHKYTLEHSDPEERVSCLIDETSGNTYNEWECRPDPFSTYRAGFEVRTYRLCQRILMVHRFQELGQNPSLVRSTDFQYAFNPKSCYSYMISTTQSGYVWQGNDYLRKSLPRIDFGYSLMGTQNNVESVDEESVENLPVGINGSTYRWVDLDGEGISGILAEQASAWHYKRNLGNARFAPVQLVKQISSVFTLLGGQQLLDLAGDGQLDFVELDPPLAGYFERTHDESWATFRPFTSAPNIPWDNPNLKFVDLSGDGHADVLIAEDEVFTWYPSLAEEGFGEAVKVRQNFDEEKGPRLIFADGLQSIYLADMSGDGLSDLVRIKNGNVCYWPNLGYGKFGSKITMDNPPSFDYPDLFEQNRIRLADIDGTGTADIIYLGRGGADCYFNRSGNGWSNRETIEAFPKVDNVSNVMVTDLLGKGTACLVWSSPLPEDSRRPFRYLDLMGEKPHLMRTVVNNMGKETLFHFAQSTRFYLEDKNAGKPWVTKLPFPVHVVTRVETLDRVSGNRFFTRYAYHHGYYDGHEREFRGFGMVEQWDTEEYSILQDGGITDSASNLNEESHVPPVYTKTWFHTGAWFERQRIEDYFREHEYYKGDLDAVFLKDTILPGNLSTHEEREACRALKGQMLRQEVYAQDNTDKQGNPYTVTEQNFTVMRLQDKGSNRHAVFFTHALETINYHYEREPADPRVSHAITLEVDDDYGNVIKSVAIGYGRRKKIKVTESDGQVKEISNPSLYILDDEDQDKQTLTLITYTENNFTNAINAEPSSPEYDPDNYRSPLPSEIRTYELTGFAPSSMNGFFTAEDFVDPVNLNLKLDNEVQYEESPDYGNMQRRLIECVRILFLKNDQSALLAMGEIESMALPGETYSLAYTPGLLGNTFIESGKINPADLDAILMNEGAYIDSGTYKTKQLFPASDNDSYWWVPSGIQFLDKDRFYLPARVVDPFMNTTAIEHDDYALLMTETVDPLLNALSAENDYRVMQPKRIKDPNGNISEAAFDALGLVVGTAVMGKPHPATVEGDTLNGFRPDLTQSEIDAFFNNPKGEAAALIMDASTRIIYDVTRYQRLGDTSKPAYAATLARETHASDPVPADGLKVQVNLSYSDGFGREIQKKIQSEPGEVDGTHTDPRWVGNGWTIFNNKGKPVRKYEPFFSNTHDFEHKEQGVYSTLFYDPIGRAVTTLHPNHTYEKVVFDPWRQKTWDVNDTVATNDTETGDPRTDTDIAGYVAGYFNKQPDTWQTWYQQRVSGAMGAQEMDAAQKAEKHANTPATAYLDALGRPFLTMTHNRFESNGVTVDETYSTRVLLDIEGNQLAVLDERKKPDNSLEQRTVMRYDHHIMGPGDDEEKEASNLIHQASMEAGERWMLNDVAGKPIRSWDSRGFARRMTYDGLRRPTGLYVTENGAERLAEQTIYGEGQGDTRNHRTRVYQVRDGAGMVTSVEYDFKGNLRESRRDLLPYNQAADWMQDPAADDGSFISSTTFDALNRPVTSIAPDGSTYRPLFNEANLLDKVEVNLRGEKEPGGDLRWTEFVANIDYNSKGQRLLIEYGNGAAPGQRGVTTEYEYDEETFRLTHLRTTRPAGLNGISANIFNDPKVVQDIRYTYDPSGNITRIDDSALKSVFYDNQTVDPACSYTYDAIYRLIKAGGREHIGQSAFDLNPPGGNYRDYPFTGNRASPNDLNALRNYTEFYEYDETGNFKTVKHIANNGRWTRTYEYNEDSLIESGIKNNRLSRTATGNGLSFSETYTYADTQGRDVHGCMTSINSMEMGWDFKDQLQQVDLGGGGNAYYVYDSGGQRVRKVIESPDGSLRSERIYLGGFEIYRQHSGSNAGLVRETLHIMDDNQRIAMVETRTQGSEPGVPEQLIRHQINNHLGSAALELTEDGALVSYEEYHPYGTTAFQAGRSAAEVSLKRYRYTGKERDEETGLYYYGARYYAVWLGRWCSTDPAGFVDGLNTYMSVRGNPLKLTDSNGMKAKDPKNTSKIEAVAKGVLDVQLGIGDAFAETGLGLVVGAFKGATDPGGIIVDLAKEPAKKFFKNVSEKSSGKNALEIPAIVHMEAGSAALDLINTLNPVARAVNHTADAVYGTGDVRETTKHITHAYIASVEAILIGIIGAKYAYSKTSAGRMDAAVAAEMDAVAEMDAAIAAEYDYSFTYSSETPPPQTVGHRLNASRVMGARASDVTGIPKSQWLHLLARRFFGGEVPQNLIAGTFEANYQMGRIEALAARAVEFGHHIEYSGYLRGTNLRLQLKINTLEVLDLNLDVITQIRAPRGAGNFFNASARQGYGPAG